MEPPGDRTQVLRIPAPDDRTTEARSIASQERPDPGADPTTRLVPPQRRAADPGEDTTADVGPRPRGVLDLERPADEAEDDTHRLPEQRRPEEAEEPTQRL